MKDMIFRQAAIDAAMELAEARRRWDTSEGRAQISGIDALICAIDDLPSAQPEITYQVCADAMLKMWIENVLTDGEYDRIMDKLNAWRCGDGEERL